MAGGGGGGSMVGLYGCVCERAHICACCLLCVTEWIYFLLDCIVLFRLVS